MQTPTTQGKNSSPILLRNFDKQLYEQELSQAS